MELSFEQVQALIELTSKSGICEFEFGGLKVKYKVNASNKFKQPKKVAEIPSIKVLEEAFKPPAHLDGLSPEEILYYATPHYDEIQAEKEARANKIGDTNV